MSKQRVVSNLLIVGTGQVVTWALSTAYLVLVSRYLGPSGQGKYALAWSIVAILGLLIGLGMDTLITRTVARSPERGGTLASAAIVVRLALALPALGLLLLYVHARNLPPDTRLVAYIMSVMMIVTSIRSVLLATFQAHEVMIYGAIVTTVENIFDLAFAFIIIRLRGHIAAFPASSLLIVLVLLLLNLRWIRRFARLTLRISWSDIREVVVGSLAFWASSVFLTIYLYIDTIVLDNLAGDRAVGFYAPATRMFSVALFLPSIIGAVTLPLLSRLGVGDASDFVRIARKTIVLLIASAVPITVGLATFAQPLMLTVFGPSYAPAAPVLVFLSLCIPCTFLNVQFSQMLAARDQQWRWTAVMALSCVLNPLVNLVLIPMAQRQWHNGAMGAALALLVTEATMAFYGLIAARDVVLNRALARTFIAALIAGAAQGGVLWLAAPLWAPLGQALGLALYSVVAIVLGVLPREDIAMLAGIIRNRLRGAGQAAASGAGQTATSLEQVPPT